jgi:hypothetical protein
MHSRVTGLGCSLSRQVHPNKRTPPQLVLASALGHKRPSKVEMFIQKRGSAGMFQPNAG